MKHLSFALICFLLVVSCGRKQDSPESDFPDPNYPNVVLTREMRSIEGVDTLWGDRVEHEYDSRGRYLAYARYDNHGTLLQRMTHSYNGRVDTVRDYDGAGNLRHMAVYTYLDTAYVHEPNYSDSYYRNPVSVEFYDADGVLLQKRNCAYDSEGRLSQVDGFDVTDNSTFVCVHLYSDRKCQSNQVQNPGTDRETSFTTERTFADSRCRYELTSTSRLSSGNLVVEYKYDTLGRVVQKLTTAAGTPIERIEYDYYPDFEREIIFDDKPLRGYLRYYRK